MEIKTRLKFGSNSLLMVGAVLAALILGYTILQRHLLRWDSTAGKEQSLSEQTKSVLAGLRQEVKISAFFRRGESVDDVFVRRKVGDVLGQYALMSPQVSFQMLDPDLNLEEALAAGVTTDGTIFFSAGTKKKTIYQSQLFDYRDTAEQAMPAFLGEELFTNAILSVTQETQKVVYFLQGHGERATDSADPPGFSEIKSHLVKNNYEVRDLSFVTAQEIPEDAGLVVIAGPRQGFQPLEDRLVRDYLARGPLLLLLEPETQPRLTETLERLKLELHADLVLDPERHFLLGAHYPAPVLGPHPITEKITGVNPVLALARSLEVEKKEETAGQGVTVLLSTSEAAWGETSLKSNGEAQFQEGSDYAGPLTVGVALQEQDRPVAVVVGDADFAANGLIAVPGNLELFLNMVSWLTGEESKLEIGPRKTVFRNMSPTPGQAQWTAYVSQLLYPLLVLAVGVVYWWRRRNR